MWKDNKYFHSPNRDGAEMTDTLNKAQRSRLMASIRPKNTRPEMVVRSLCHSMGYRFRLHVRALPSVPDIVFPGRKKVVFVHGCFWHRHWCKRGRSNPKTQVRFWRTKFEGNVRRDRAARRALRRAGWCVLVLWECELYDLKKLCSRLRAFLG